MKPSKMGCKCWFKRVNQILPKLCLYMLNCLIRHTQPVWRSMQPSCASPAINSISQWTRPLQGFFWPRSPSQKAKVTIASAMNEWPVCGLEVLPRASLRVMPVADSKPEPWHPKGTGQHTCTQLRKETQRRHRGYSTGFRIVGIEAVAIQKRRGYAARMPST